MTSENLNTPLSITDKTGEQKIHKDIVHLNININQLDLTLQHIRKIPK